jgi:DNA gyrase/topoisomerase IV subunit B
LLLFFSRWPELFSEGRILRVQTPLFIAKKKGKPTKYFYSFEDYEENKKTVSGYEVSYIKGLGTLEEDDYAETVIKNPRLTAISLDDIDKLIMAFGNDAERRKEWMLN